MGAMKVAGWTIERGNRGLNAEWIARHPSDHDVTCWLKDRTLVVDDDVGYYPSGRYDIPLAVIEALQARAPRP